MAETVEVERLSYGSDAVAHLESGKAVFVAEAVPGDVVELEVLEEKPSFARARIRRLVEPSPLRVRSRCPNPCGGCPWAMVSYEGQLAAKRNAVVDALSRTGGVAREAAESMVGACVATDEQWGYRNKMELAATRAQNGQLILGFHREGSSEVVSVERCPVAASAMEKAPKALSGALRYLAGTEDLGIFRVGMRASRRTGSSELALWTAPSGFPRAAAKKLLTSACNPTSIVRVLADAGPARKVKKVEALAGKGCWEEKLRGCRFFVSAPSFFQVNTAQAEKLVQLAAEGLGLGRGDFLIDLYAGCGTFSIPFAKGGAEVAAVESAGSAVRDLRRNAECNGVEVEVVGGDAACELAPLGSPDGLVVDPPRSGLAKEAIAAIADAAPQRMAYVSCDPQTWARDVARLSAKGFVLEAVTPVDLFPQTFHVETVSLFRRA